MPRTEEMEFEVVGSENNHLWFRVLYGSDKGMRVSVPVRHPEYDTSEISILNKLTEGDIVAATLINENGEYAGWRVESIRTTSPDSDVTAPSTAD
ncbi:hypothetical protein [Halobaculum sp. MBLA0143]|uniref:hypothetical protein n=1 Tax=Halobaculum sp. MBLA0143 TaxID=3079933 RepID=UPI003526702E